MSDERYNGWTNYATWNVALWLGNDQGLYNAYREMVAEVCEDVTEPDYEWQTIHDSRKYAVAERLESFVDDLAEETCFGVVEGASFVTDLFGWALGQVDWFEIADNYVSEWEETAEEVDA
jgi:hypothetical protein